MGCHKIFSLQTVLFLSAALGLLILTRPPSAHAIKYPFEDLLLEDAGAFDKAFLEQNKDAIIEDLKRNLVNGNLAGIGPMAWRLLQVAPNNADLHALYSLHLFSRDAVDDAQKQLKKARRLNADNSLVLYAQAMSAFIAKDFDTAVQLSERAISKNKQHPFPYNMLGSIYFEQDRLNLATENFRTAVKLNPRFAPAYTNLGFLAIRKNDFNQARRHFSKSLELSPKTASPHYGLALVYDHEGKFDFAMQHLKKSLGIKSNQPGALEKLAELQLKTARYTEALQTAAQLNNYNVKTAKVVMAEAYLHIGESKKALLLLDKIEPKDIHVHYLTGLGYMQSEKYRDALRQLTKVLEIDDRHVSAHLSQLSLQNYLGQRLNAEAIMRVKGSGALDRLKFFMAGCIYAQQNQWSQAVQSWQNAAGLFHGFSLYGLSSQKLQNNLKTEEFKYILMGLVYSSQRMDTAAIKQLQRALQVNPGSIWSNYLIAQVYQRRGDKAKAISHFEASLRETPEFMAALIALGDIGFLTQDAQLASVYYTKALALKPNPILTYRLGSVYEKTGAFDKAEAQYNKLVNEYPKSFLGYNQLAWFYAKQGVNLEKALRLAQNANKLQPDNPIILDTIGWIYFQKSDLKNAEKYLKRAIEKTDQIPSIIYHYAAVMQAMGNQEQARLFMLKALNISHKFEGADDALKFIQKEK